MKIKEFSLVILMLVLAGCVSVPDGLSYVTDFNGQRYMGKWYEVARIDNRFEKGLTQVTAEYSIEESGKITVINRGFDAENDEWKQAEGKAYFVNSNTEGYLKVSFFGPFYSPYVVFELDDNYDYAFVSGADKDYLWLLSRAPVVGEDVKHKFMSTSAELGFDINKVIWVKQ